MDPARTGVLDGLRPPRDGARVSWNRFQRCGRRKDGEQSPVQLRGKRILLTGACGGVGAALAQGLAHEGATLFLTDVEADGLSEVRRKLDGGQHRHLAHRLGGAADADLARRAAEGLGGLDCVVHTAAVLRRQPLDQVTEEDWDIQHTVNLKSAFFLARACAEHMRVSGTGGRIVLFSSQSFFTGGFDASVVYASTKGGLTTLSRGLARTYGPFGITCNAVAPGIVDTPMLRDQLSEQALSDIVEATPLGRVATPEDMTGPVVFLCSDASRFVTGTVINASGGWLSY